MKPAPAVTGIAARSSRDVMVARLGIPMLLLAAAAGSLRPGLEHDAWWHLASGRWMLDGRSWLRVDPFSWTAQGRDWPRPGLVADIAMAWLHRLGGAPLLVVAAAGCFVVALAVVLSVVRGSPMVVLGVGLLVIVNMVPFATPRPLVASLSLTSICVAITERDRTWPEGSRWLYALPVVALVWVNVHGAFVVLFALLGCHGLGLLIEATRHEGSARWQPLRRVALVGALSVLATLVNPFGARMLTYPLETLQLGVLSEAIDEWQRPTLTDPQSWPLFILLVTAAIAFLWARDRRPVDVLLLLVFGALAMTAVRHAGTVAIVLFPVVVRLLSRTQPIGMREAWSVADRKERRIEGILLGVIAGLSALLTYPALTVGGNQSAIDAFHGDRAIARVAEGDLPERLWNSYDLGGHVIWLGTPNVLVSMDSRTDLHGDHAVREHLAEWHGERDAPTRFSEQTIRTVLVERNAPLVDQLVDAGWSPVESDDVAVVLRSPIED